MEQQQVDGVPVLWTEGPGPLSAGLVVGVGRRDETWARGGLTHLVEHLVMDDVGRTPLDAGATVDLDTTHFQVSGQPDRVAAFLRRVCEALAALAADGPTAERVAVEAGVLRAEGGGVAPPALRALLAERYGGRGLGLAGFPEPALGDLRPRHVQHWAATRFVRGAAALWLSGPPPDGLALPLPDGPAPPRAVQVPLDLPTPVAAPVPVDGVVGVGAEVVRVAGLGAACRVLRERAERDLRHGRGLSYGVGLEHVPVEGPRRFVAVHADCRDGQEAVAARALWRALARLADDGPTEAELARDRDLVAEHLADPRTVLEQVQAEAAARVTGEVLRTAEQRREESLALTAEQLRAATAAVRDAAVLVLPDPDELGLHGLAPVPGPPPPVQPGRVFAGRRRGPLPRGSRLVVADDGVTADLGPEGLSTVLRADSLGLLQVEPERWVLVGATGATVELAPADWDGGEQALALVRAAVPAEEQVVADGVEPESRSVLLLAAPPHAVAEALWPSRRDAWLAQTPRWALVVRTGDEAEALEDAAGASAVLRRSAVLVLRQAHGELRLTPVHRGTPGETHLFTGEPADPGLVDQLARLLDAAPGEVAALLAHPGSPAEVLGALTAALGVPEPTAAVLAGRPPAQVPGLVHEPARGVRQSLLAAYRGELDPPDSPLLRHRLVRWENERPAAYRAANGAAALAQAVLAVRAARGADGGWRSRRGALAAALGASALGSLWSTRPPRRP